MSIGGATYTEGGFSSPADAIASADTVWETFGSQTQTAHSKHQCRSFGDAVVDDFDIETPVRNMPAFGNRLRELVNGHQAETEAQSRTSPRQKFYLTAAPQCPFSDKDVGPILDEVAIDPVFVQFYNNPQCGLNAFQAGYNFEQWDRWAHAQAKNKGARVFIGVAGSVEAATTGYVDGGRLGEIV